MTVWSGGVSPPFGTEAHASALARAARAAHEMPREYCEADGGGTPPLRVAAHCANPPYEKISR
jgi:hypothetical protein